MSSACTRPPPSRDADGCSLVPDKQNSATVFTVYAGVRYKGYCANIGRTLLINPSSEMEARPTVWSAADALPARVQRRRQGHARRRRRLQAGQHVWRCQGGPRGCSHGHQVYKAIHSALGRHEDGKGNSLATKMFKQIGFSIGYELRESPIVLQEGSKEEVPPG